MRTILKGTLAFTMALMLSACFPLGQVQDHRKAPGNKGAPWPSCTPRESPACVGQ
jgi:starvation-inducible outer membrane lipoprotein